MSSAFVFEGLKMHLKARGMTYADVARGLRISEPTGADLAAARHQGKRVATVAEWVRHAKSHEAHGHHH